MMKFKTKLDQFWFYEFVEIYLEELEKGRIDEKKFVEAIKAKHQEIKDDNFSKMIISEI